MLLIWIVPVQTLYMKGCTHSIECVLRYSIARRLWVDIGKKVRTFFNVKEPVDTAMLELWDREMTKKSVKPASGNDCALLCL
jgi:hypothetical protein